VVETAATGVVILEMVVVVAVVLAAVDPVDPVDPAAAAAAAAGLWVPVKAVIAPVTQSANTSEPRWWRLMLMSHRAIPI